MNVKMGLCRCCSCNGTAPITDISILSAIGSFTKVYRLDISLS